MAKSFAPSATLLHFLFLVVALGLATASLSALADGPARVIVVKGEAKTDQGKKIVENQSIPMGTLITTAARSFVKLLFTDNTQMSIGPNSAIKVELVAPGQANLIQLIGGQIRSKVYKDVLKNNDKEPENKLLIKTKSAAMGIRGTDFLATYNEINNVSTLLVFDGVVAMAKVSGNDAIEIALRDPNRVQSVPAGTVSMSNPSSNFATAPIKVSPSQLESLKTNENLDFSNSNKEASPPPPSNPSPIAPGLDPIKSSLNYSPFDSKSNSFSPSNSAQTTEGRKAENGPPNDNLKPGGNFDILTGTYVQPPPGSVYDANAGVFISPSSFGGTDLTTGGYNPPDGLTLDALKGFVPTTDGQNKLSAEQLAQIKTYAEILNTTMSSKYSGSGSTFDKTFAPTNAGPGKFIPEIRPTMPFDPTKNQAFYLMPPKEPINDSFCPTCLSDNVNSFPPQTTVKFRFE